VTVVTPSAPELSSICRSLYRIAQKHVSTTAFSDVNELLHISKILEAHAIPIETNVKLRAITNDHDPAVAKQSDVYRLLRAQFKAALSTIADLGRKQSKTHKSPYHEGVQAGLRKAAKIAIIFLDDLNDETVWLVPSENAAKPVKGVKNLTR